MVDTTTPPSSSAADTIKTIVHIVGTVANIALKVDRTAEEVAPWLAPVITPLFPAYPAIVAGLAVADPILAKIAAASPGVEGVVEASRPVIEAAQAQAPAIVAHVKGVLETVLDRAAADLPHIGAPSIVPEHVEALGAIMFAGTSLEAVWKASQFSPQDPRFDRVDAGRVGG